MAEQKVQVSDARSTQVISAATTVVGRPGPEGGEPELKRSRIEPTAGGQPDAHADDDTAASALRGDLGVRVRGQGCPPPVRSFGELALPDAIADSLARRGFLAPTPIQAQAWPAALGGRDVVGIAQTGSGKTLCFALPAVARILATPVVDEDAASAGPIALALAPTRELAAQICDEVSRLDPTISVCCVQGGVSRGEQLLQLRLGAEFVAATPGRLSDLLTRGKISLRARLSLLVLDEADRLLEMGFEEQLTAIVAACPARGARQTLMWSATWSAPVALLAAALLNEPIHVEACATASAAELARAPTAGAAAPPPAVPRAISQRVLPLRDAADKLGALVRLLEEELLDDAPEAPDLPAAAGARAARVLVFVSSKRRADELTAALRADGWPALGLHGDKCQLEREWALGEFRAGRAPVLVATDVAQRGLDIRRVGAVVNYDAPPSIDAYVHRVGRTGRAGACGSAHTLWVAMEPAERALARELGALLVACGQPVPPGGLVV
jgi:ATP-dependent RNA helicase DDX5/DBP2